ncbi:MAG: leucine-rich repeat domain-containing protein [Christensenellales bacterium]
MEDSKVEIIPENCFEMCTELTNISFPKSLSKIESKAFLHCGVQELTFPKSLTTIYDYAFDDCKQLNTIDLENTQMEVLSAYAFNECFNISKVKLPNTLKTIESYAFESTQIEEIDLPDSIEIIGAECFYSCKKLKQIRLPKNLRFLGSNTFAHCSNLETVDLSNTNVEAIKAGTFYLCTKLKNVFLNNAIVNIEFEAFASCTSLKEINLPNTLVNLSQNAFLESGLTSIDLSKTKVEKIEEGCFSYCKDLTNVIFSDTITFIGHHAFKSCPIETIKLPKSLTTIDNTAFFQCKQLRSVDLSETQMQKINQSTFYDCTNLNEVMLPKQLQLIESNAFTNTSISEIEFPHSLKRIDYKAFSNCSKLAQVDLTNTKLTAIKESAFDGCTELESAKLPPTLKEMERLSFGPQTTLEFCTLPLPLNIIMVRNAFGYTTSFTEEPVKEMPNTIILHLDKIKSLREHTDAEFNFEQFCKKRIKRYLQQHFYTQIIGSDIIVTNDRSKLIPKTKYYYYPILNSNKKWIDDLEHFKFYNDLVKYEIPLPIGIIKLIKQNYDINPNFMLNFSKFKRVSNIIEHIYSTTNIAIENINDFYRLAYNLGAFSEDEQTRTTVCNFLKDKLIRGELNLFTMHQDYDSMKFKGEKKEFTEFYIKNFTALNQKGGHFICDAYNNFNSYQKWHTSNRGSQRQLKPSIESLEVYFAEKKANALIYSNEVQKNIAKEISQFFIGTNTFETAYDIMEEFKINNIEKSLIQDKNAIIDLSLIKNTNEKSIEANRQLQANNTTNATTQQQPKAQQRIATNTTSKYTAKKHIYTYNWLDKDDVRNLTLGKYCNCCAHLEGAGFGIMRASIICPNVQNLVILKDNKIVAKSTLYLNKEKCYGVFNNVEVSKEMTNEDKAEIYNAYIRGVQAFVTQYNIENPQAQLKQVNVGLHLNDLFTYLAKDKSDILPSLNYAIYSNNDLYTYVGDAMSEEGQACLYRQKTKSKDEEMEK